MIIQFYSLHDYSIHKSSYLGDKISPQDDTRKYHTSFITAIIRAIASCRTMAEFLSVIAGSYIEITN